MILIVALLKGEVHSSPDCLTFDHVPFGYPVFNLTAYAME